MNKKQGKHIISPSDLVNHHACQHVTRLELERLDGRIPSPPDYKDEFLEMLQERGGQEDGRESNQVHLDRLRQPGRGLQAR